MQITNPMARKKPMTNSAERLMGFPASASAVTSERVHRGILRRAASTVTQQLQFLAWRFGWRRPLAYALLLEIYRIVPRIRFVLTALQIDRDRELSAGPACWHDRGECHQECSRTEDAVWAQAKPPLGDYVYPSGAFGLIESPRGSSSLDPIPCDWLGNFPIVWFFPELAKSTLKIFKHFQRADGAAPVMLGTLGTLPDFVTPSYEWQISLNSTAYVDLVDRLWQRTGADALLREFYDSVKRSNTLTMNLRQGPAGVISMPEGNKGMEWFELGEWAGMCAHLGGLHLAQLRIVERMARHVGDEAYAQQCQTWLDNGSRAMEEEMWAGNYYLNFYEKETGKKSDDVMGYQLDGEWAARFHGLPGVFRADRVKATLETIKRCNIRITPEVGAATFARPDGKPLDPRTKVAAYGSYAIAPPEVLVLAMTYILNGEKEFGLDLARRHWENLVCRQRLAWDLPNVVRGDTGVRTIGTDYYMCMMLWALPAVLEDVDLAGFCAPGSFIDRVIKAGRSA